MSMVHADHCIDAPLDHTGPCKKGFSVAGVMDATDKQGLDDSLSTPLTDSNRKHRVTEVPLPDMVDHPPHYGGRDDHYEVIKVLEAWMTPEEVAGFCLGNTIKYVGRAGKKGDRMEDLKKARWYLDRYISYQEQHTSA